VLDQSDGKTLNIGSTPLQNFASAKIGSVSQFQAICIR
jgi:hypothetical protein